MTMVSTAPRSWLVLIHQIPPHPAYLRVKIWRRLQDLGAVTLKNSVYVLPNTEQSHEDLQWVIKEIGQKGGEAVLSEARFIEGVSDSRVEGLFRAARGADYRQIATEAGSLLESLSSGPAASRGTGPEVASHLVRLKRRLAAVRQIDYFRAPERQAAEKALARLEARARAPRERGGEAKPPGRLPPLTGLRGRTWVTRRDIHVDRMASAWLIRRFIDPRARFKFVPSRGYRPRASELRFDMFDAEFTHQGDACTFEVVLSRSGLKDPALRPVAEIVHDIDLRDTKFGRPEAAGIERLIAGIATGYPDDEGRLARGSAVFDDLYECYRRKR